MLSGLSVTQSSLIHQLQAAVRDLFESDRLSCKQKDVLEQKAIMQVFCFNHSHGISIKTILLSSLALKYIYIACTK